MVAFFKQHISWFAPVVLAAFVLVGALIAFAPPLAFPRGAVITITRGESAPVIVAALGEKKIIAHPVLLRAVFRLSGTSGSVQAGTYRFETPQGLLTIAYRLLAGDYGFPPVRLTFVEGVTAREVALQVADAFPGISADDVVIVAKPYEGYLFPDTYRFSPGTEIGSVVAMMRANFNTKVAPLAPEIAASGHSLSDIVIVASLVEKEARTSESRRLVAGILWNRLRIGMPLQVDAVFGYIFDRDTYSPSYTDLKVDSPYNTYTHTGLPPAPIDNPGLDALDAALHPTKTNYLYYLTGKDNQMHYATTFAGHQMNQDRYLR